MKKQFFLFALILNLTTSCSFFLPPDSEEEESSKDCKQNNFNRDHLFGIYNLMDRARRGERINRESEQFHEATENAGSDEEINREEIQFYDAKDDAELAKEINQEHEQCHEIYDRYIRDLKAGNDTVWLVNCYNSLNKNLLSSEINTCNCYNEIQVAVACINKFLRKYPAQVKFINKRNSQNNRNNNANINKSKPPTEEKKSDCDTIFNREKTNKNSKTNTEKSNSTIEISEKKKSDCGPTFSQEKTKKEMPNENTVSDADKSNKIHESLKTNRSSEDFSKIINTDNFKTENEAEDGSASGESEIPKIDENDLSLAELPIEVQDTINILNNAEFCKKIKLKNNSGLLLYGPPGTGKTTLAEIIAAKTNRRLFKINGTELLNSYLGQSEKNLRESFQKAKACKAPAILFFDEVQTIASASAQPYTQSLRDAFNQEMNSILNKNGQSNYDIFCIAATNDLENIDSATKSRFTHVSMQLPSENQRYNVIAKECRQKEIEIKDIEIREIAKKTENWSIRDISSTINKSPAIALRENKRKIEKKHLEQAFAEEDARKRQEDWDRMIKSAKHYRDVAADGAAQTVGQLSIYGIIGIIR